MISSIASVPLAVDKNWSIKLTRPGYGRRGYRYSREGQADIITILFTIDQSFRC